MLRLPVQTGRLAIAAALVALAGSGNTALAAGPPPGLPGPPPGAGTGLPLPPPPGQAPPAQASLPAVGITGAPYGPGLLSGYSAVSGTKLPVTIACQADGEAQLRTASVSVKTAYRCARGRSTIRFVLTRSQARGIAKSSGLVGALTLSQGAQTVHLSLSLGRSAPTPVFWTSAFGLGCTAGGAQSAQLVAPNFTSTVAPTTIDVRPWLAWYTSAGGWQWLGARGAGSSAWYRWTATPTGVAEWQQPTGINPWTWGPIGIVPGHGTYLIAVLEAVYWYSHPRTIWEYARSEPSPTTVTTYCAYP
jgi:hypothetical protein